MNVSLNSDKREEVVLPLREDHARHHSDASPEPTNQNFQQRGRPKDSANSNTIKSALYELKNPLNVLVLGPHDSGKTTVINSLLMAVRKQWTDRARYGHGGKHQFAPVLLYENPNYHP